MLTLLLFISLFVACENVSLKDDAHHDGIVSDEEHYTNEDGHEHEHNTQYDHEAFLGKDEAESYNELTPEESKDKLGEIFHRIDVDGDGEVTKVELEKWIYGSQTRYAKVDAIHILKEKDSNKDDRLTWDEYKENAYGFLDKNGEPKKDVDVEKYDKFDEGQNTKEHYAKQLSRDERRYKAADKDGDQMLTLEELSMFLYPEVFEGMQGVVALETIEDLDKDKDGLINLKEFLTNMSPDEPQEKGKEPEWLQEERENFTASYDKNKDGKLDVEEVKGWIFPSEEHHLEAEIKHLISESDANGDGTISKEEMLEKYETFVGSQATDYGELLRHQEL